MKTSRAFTRQPWLKVAAVSLVWLLAVRLGAQQGPNAVYSSLGTPSPSYAFFDASAFTLMVGTTPYTDICARIFAVLTSTNYPPQTGAVIDARGVLNASDLSCPTTGPTGHPTTPWVYGNGVTNNPSIILLPDAIITIPTTWVLPNGTRLVGEQTTDAIALHQDQNPHAAPTLQVATSFTNAPDGSNAMIEMGSGASGLPGVCPGVPCYGISVEHLTILGKDQNGAVHNVKGIYNHYAQEQSYVNDLDLWSLADTGIDVESDASGSATGSGPYSNFNFLSSGTAACVVLNAQTRGVRGATCIGSTFTAAPVGCGGSGGNLAAIYVTAGNNSLDDLHIESFCDAVQVAGPSTQTSNVVISNLVTAQKGGTNNCADAGIDAYPPVANSVHICGPHPSDNALFGQCQSAYMNTNVSDVSAFQVTGTTGSPPIAVIQDDQTGTSIGFDNPKIPYSVGNYSLGEGLVSQNSPYGYSRFSTSPSTLQQLQGGSIYSTVVPTWGVGGTPPTPSSCPIPGALYSDPACQEALGQQCTIYVCTSHNQWAAII